MESESVSIGRYFIESTPLKTEFPPVFSVICLKVNCVIASAWKENLSAADAVPSKVNRISLEVMVTIPES